jgi:hypothetical protein
LIILFFLPAGMPLILAIDETLERRRGPQIKYKGWFRDAILSTKARVVTALGIRWICLAVVVPVPWSQRTWALPFMTVLALGEKTSAKLNKRHRTIVQWAEYIIDTVRLATRAGGIWLAMAVMPLSKRNAANGSSPLNWSRLMPVYLTFQSTIQE